MRIKGDGTIYLCFLFRSFISFNSVVPPCCVWGLNLNFFFFFHLPSLSLPLALQSMVWLEASDWSGLCLWQQQLSSISTQMDWQPSLLARLSLAPPLTIHIALQSIRKTFEGWNKEPGGKCASKWTKVSHGCIRDMSRLQNGKETSCY